MRPSRFLLAGVAATLCACQPTSLPATALASYVDDPGHGLRQMQQVGSTEVSVTYQPPDLLVARELQGHKPTPAVLDSLRKKYRGSTFFLLSIARNGHEVLQPTEGFSAYSELLQTLAFRMGDYTRLITSQGDTLRPANYYLDRTYASSSASQLLFAFPAAATAGTWRFQLGEFGLGTGNLLFPFDAHLAHIAPALATD